MLFRSNIDSTIPSFSRIFGFAFSLFIVGCASDPSQVSVDDKKFAELGRTRAIRLETANYQIPKIPEAGKALVYVVRAQEFRGSFVRFNIFVDGQNATSEMGWTRPGQYIHFNLVPGEHKVYSDAENWSEKVVNVKAGDVICLEQRVEMGLLFAKDFLTEIPEHEGKYLLKSSTLGTIIKTDKGTD